MSGLSYQQGPPLALPLRFFLAAPLFLMLAGVAALAAGPAALASRWNPAVAAITHLLTLGYLAMVMVGALLQMLPVVLGARIPAVRAVAGVALVGLVAGTPLLAAGLAWTDPVLLDAAMALLAAGLLPFLVAMAVSLLRSGVASSVAWPMRQAWLGLALTLALGLHLAAGLAGRAGGGDFAGLVQLHLAWGLGGWVLILVVGVAYQVVPMLQLTPAYPALATRWLTWLILLGLVAYGGGQWLHGVWPDVGLTGVALGASSFALLTLWLHKRRRRKLGDTTLSFWRLGMASLLGCVLLAPWLHDDRLQLVFGLLFLLGFAASVVNGMLYKIVPFLAWFHLQAQTQARAGAIPNMKEFVPDALAGRHLRLHLAALACLLPAPFLPWPAAAAGWLLLILSGDRLWRNLLAARRAFLAHGGRL
ncbi:MAG TPA: hypothetical protein VF811_11365 [Parasulfuritortus sp.]